MSEFLPKKTELDQVASDLHEEVSKIKQLPPSKSDNAGQETNEVKPAPSKLGLKYKVIHLKRRSRSKDHHKHHSKKKIKAVKKAVRFELVKFKFIQRVDDDFVMEYKLRPEDIMEYRKNHFHLYKEPHIEVRATKTSELKEEFGNYCGAKKSIKNWLYWV